MTWMSLAARSLNLVLLIPFILREFSPAEISLWYLFSTIISLNLLVDLGFGVTFIRVIAYAMGGVGHLNQLNAADAPASDGPNRARLLKVVGTMMALYKGLAAVVFVLLGTVGTLSVLVPIRQLDDPLTGWASWSVVTVVTTYSFWGNTYAIYLQGTNRIAEFRRYETLFTLLAILSSVGVLWLNAGLLGLVCVNQFWIVATVLRNRWLSKRTTEGVFTGAEPLRLDRGVLKEIWPSTWRSGLGVAMTFGLFNGSSLVFAQTGQVEQVSSYLFAVRVMQIITTFAQAPFYSKLPLLAKLYARQEHDQLIELAQTSMMRAHWTFVAGFGGIALLAEPLMSSIGSQIQFVEPTLWALMGLTFFIERYGAMHLQLYSLSNHIVWHIANGTSGLIYLVLAILSYPYLGVYAFPVSLLLAYAGFYVGYSVYKSNREFNLNILTFERKAVLFPFCGMVLTILSSLLF